MPDRGRRRVVVQKTAIGDPTFLLQFALETEKEEKVPLRINIKIGENENSPEFTKKIKGTFPTNKNIRIMCSYSGSLKHVSIPGNVCLSLLESDEKTVNSEAQIYYDNLKKVPATTLSLKEKQTVHFHFLDGNEDDYKNEVFLTYKAKKSEGNRLFTRDVCISSDSANKWKIEQISPGIKRYWIKNKNKYLTAIKDKVLVMTTNPSEGSEWVCQEARTERYGQEISIYAIKHHVNKTYLLCDSGTGKVFLQEHSLPVFPWYLHPKVKNPK